MLPRGEIVRGDLTEQPTDHREDRTSLTGELRWGERGRGPPNCSRGASPREGLHPPGQGCPARRAMRRMAEHFPFLLLECEESYYNATFII